VILGHDAQHLPFFHGIDIGGFDVNSHRLVSMYEPVCGESSLTDQIQL